MLLLFRQWLTMKAGCTRLTFMLWLPARLVITMETNLMNTTTNTSIVIAFVVVVVLLLLFGAGAMTAGMMNGGAHESGWMAVRSWMWTPALLTLGLGVVLGQFILKKKDDRAYVELKESDKLNTKG